MVTVRIFGSRGSRPAVGPEYSTFGGDTSFVVLEAGGEPVLLDLGTGMAGYARQIAGGEPLRASALLSHYHFDHVQGLPFFTQLDREGARLQIYAPLGMDPLAHLFAPPYFPVSPFEFKGETSVVAVREGRFKLVNSGVEVLAREVPHTDTAFGYRIETHLGMVVCYIPDLQAPRGLDTFADAALDLAADADLVLLDSQYNEAEFEEKGHWGHSTQAYAAALAHEANAKELLLFHHDPARSDAELLSIEREFSRLYRPRGLRVAAARQGSVLQLAPGQITEVRAL